MKQNNKDKQNNTVQLNFIFVLLLNSLEQFSLCCDESHFLYVSCRI